MTNSCCCAQRFPVIRLGEGKYRIGEGGTIIFIRVKLLFRLERHLLSLFCIDSSISCYGSSWWWLGYTGELSK